MEDEKSRFFLKKLLFNKNVIFKLLQIAKAKMPHSYAFLKPDNVHLHKQLTILYATIAQAKYHCSKPQKLIWGTIFQAK